MEMSSRRDAEGRFRGPIQRPGGRPTNRWASCRSVVGADLCGLAAYSTACALRLSLFYAGIFDRLGLRSISSANAAKMCM